MAASRLSRAAFGALLLIGGAAGMGVVTAATYGRGAACQQLLFALGLPGSLLLSSLAQCALFLGAWLLSSTWRRVPGT